MKENPTEIKIYSSKLKPLLPLIVLIIAFFIYDHLILNMIAERILIFIFIVSFVFLLYLFDFFNHRPKLIINNKGISDFSRTHSIGFVPWEDVQSIITSKFFFHTRIHIIVRQPKLYIEKQRKWKQKNLIRNIRRYNTPISISAFNFNIRTAKLISTIKKYYYRSIKNN